MYLAKCTERTFLLGPQRHAAHHDKPHAIPAQLLSAPEHRAVQIERIFYSRASSPCQNHTRWEDAHINRPKSRQLEMTQ